MKRLLEAPGTFDDRGWLTVGFAGHQPHLGELHFDGQSVSLREAVLPLGLKAADAFSERTGGRLTSRRIWRGAPADHAIAG
jgi:hypothetical protein